MTEIMVCCPECYLDSSLTTDQIQVVTLHAPTAQDDERKEWAFYAFTCTQCQIPVRKRACAAAVSLLAQAGIQPEEWTVPAEALEPREGPRLTVDDVLDFRLELARADRLSTIARWSGRHAEGAA